MGYRVLSRRACAGLGAACLTCVFIQTLCVSDTRSQEPMLRLLHASLYASVSGLAPLNAIVSRMKVVLAAGQGWACVALGWSCVGLGSSRVGLGWSCVGLGWSCIGLGWSCVGFPPKGAT